uniref:Uncharacterized protein n=1 Tax=Physcomitrium patens TaxID=3218 RepID=A0A2K1JRD6_PHYPA|nr:hypothetical protein PHYPA_016475 [Physcomitrium patens]
MDDLGPPTPPQSMMRYAAAAGYDCAKKGHKLGKHARLEEHGLTGWLANWLALLTHSLTHSLGRTDGEGGPCILCFV